MDQKSPPPASNSVDESWSVYIVRCADGSLYTGIAKDVEARIKAHNAGKGAKYTRSRGPVKLVYEEAGHRRGGALRREHAIKQLSLVQKKSLFKEVDR